MMLQLLARSLTVAAAAAAAAALALQGQARAQAASAAAANRVDWAVGSLACQRNPEYPPAAMRARAIGDTTVHVHADADDNIVDVHLLRPSGMTREHVLLDDAVLAVLRQCRFARAASTPRADQWSVITFRWRIEDGGKVLQASDAELANLRSAAEQGDADEALNFYLRAPYRPDTVVESVRLLQFAAERNVVFAQYELGRLYTLGEGLPLDKHQTVAWWGRASAQHDLRATLALARLLLDDASGQRDPVRALELLNQAVAQKSGAAMLLLGDVAAAGTAGTRDDRAARAWWRRAVREAQVGSACVRLGDAYASGQGVKPDPAIAATYYVMARSLLEPTATARLADLKADGAAVEKAEAWVNNWRMTGQRTLPDDDPA